MSTAPPPPQVKSFNCPNCGAPVVIRGFATTLSVVCGNCHSILDAKDPNFAVLQRFQAAERIQPLIPLGTRGKIRGDPYEVIGFQVRTITAEGVDYSWEEYLLFNPYKGFRYLTQYQGHWNDTTVLRTLPEVDSSGRSPRCWAGRSAISNRPMPVPHTFSANSPGRCAWARRPG
jgi:ribosomal protein S27AE